MNEKSDKDHGEDWLAGFLGDVSDAEISKIADTVKDPWQDVRAYSEVNQLAGTFKAKGLATEAALLCAVAGAIVTGRAEELHNHIVPWIRREFSRKAKKRKP